MEDKLLETIWKLSLPYAARQRATLAYLDKWREELVNKSSMHVVNVYGERIATRITFELLTNGLAVLLSSHMDWILLVK